MNDLISRQVAIDIAYKYKADIIAEEIEELPSVQPEPSIPLSWIEEHIEWLKSCDNEFANLAAMHISTMLKKWGRDEQNGQKKGD